MIRVTVDLIPGGEEPGKELARMEIVNVWTDPKAIFAEYSIQIVVRHPNGNVAVHQRLMSRFHRGRYNVLGLLLESLRTLDEKDLLSEEGKDW